MPAQAAAIAPAKSNQCSKLAAKENNLALDAGGLLA
jgi:hypothetical protein